MKIPENVNDDILDYLIAMVFLRSSDIPNALYRVIALMNERRIEGAARFQRYYVRMWLPIAHIISVYGRRTRTTNIAENFHKYARQYLGVHQNLWKMLCKYMLCNHRITLSFLFNCLLFYYCYDFLDKLSRMMTSYDTEYERTSLGRVLFEKDLHDANKALDLMEPRYTE